MAAINFKVMTIVVVTVCAICWSADARPESVTRLPSSWSRTTCVSAPKIVDARDGCKNADGSVDHKLIVVCMLQAMEVLGADKKTIDYTAAQNIVDAFTHTTDAQKQSIKNSLVACKDLPWKSDTTYPQCVYERLTKRCVDKAGDMKKAEAA